jgi:hypothetical protein
LEFSDVSIGNVLANDLIVKAARAKALPKTKILDVVNQWESSDHIEFRDRNVNSLYNAFTEVYKGNLIALPGRSEALHSLLDNYVDFDIKKTEEDWTPSNIVDEVVAF